MLLLLGQAQMVGLLGDYVFAAFIDMEAEAEQQSEAAAAEQQMEQQAMVLRRPAADS